MILKGCDGGGAVRWIFVVSCPAWYFGNIPELTCMLLAEASSVLRELDMPRMCPDSVMRAGRDADGSRRDALLEVSSKLCSDDRLSMVAVALEETASRGDMRECIAAPLS